VRAACTALLIAIVTLFPGSAMAGRLIVTGHDADDRCAASKQQCGFLKTAIKYVRESAPNARKPVLVLDTAPKKQLDGAITEAFAGNDLTYSMAAALLPTKRVEPQSALFRRMHIDVKHWSAIAVASDASAGGDLTSADEAAIYSRRKVIQKFLSQGGGIYVGAGGTNAAYYYRFMPIPTPGPGDSGPFTLTAYGKEIGFKTRDVNAPVANTFAAPDVGRMDVAAQSTNATDDTLIADGKVVGGQLVANATIPPALGQSIVVQPVSGVVLGHPPDDPTFRRIVGVANLVNGWTFDVTKGRVALTTAQNSRGASGTAQAFEGFFTALTANTGVTDLVLRSGNFDQVCGSGGVDIADVNTTSVRHLWASGKGKFRTKGRFASAAIRGTEWETDDRCDGTLVSVKTGTVSVFDNTLQRTIAVSAGNSYLAKAP
jgi:hypothetical protein